MNVAVLGFGIEGQVSAAYWQAKGDTVTIRDRNPDTKNDNPKYEFILGDSYLENLDQYDLIVRSPGIHPAKIKNANPEIPNILDKVTSNVNEFFAFCPTKNIIGVTGTKGKGTTSTLITRMLEATGKTVHLAGNIGTAPLKMLPEIKEDDWVVLELSSFQLIDIKYSPHIAVCLMVVDEHLDWHVDRHEYIRAKQQLFAHQKPTDLAIYIAQNNPLTMEIVTVTNAKKIGFMESPGAHIAGDKIIIDDIVICDTKDVKLPGRHNWQNICAAVTAIWQVSKDVEAIKDVLSNFHGLPHRIELVREFENVRFYNDSFASNPGATVAAIHSVSGMKVLIIGGFDRMLDLTHLANEILEKKDEFRKVMLIGSSAQRLKNVLDEAGFNNTVICTASTMPVIIKHARFLAKEGDAIVFSPGFPSFDMFKNFEDRGNQFRENVQNL